MMIESNEYSDIQGYWNSKGENEIDIVAINELEKRLEKSNLGGRIASIETADKMTDKEIAAKVRQRFRDTELW